NWAGCDGHAPAPTGKPAKRPELPPFPSGLCRALYGSGVSWRQRASSRLPLAQTDIKRAMSAMMPCGIFEASDQAAERRRGKPLRNDAPQHAFSGGTLARNNQNIALIAGVCPVEEGQEQHIGFVLRKSVQVDSSGDLKPSLGKLVFRRQIELA